MFCSTSLDHTEENVPTIFNPYDNIFLDGSDCIVPVKLPCANVPFQNQPQGKPDTDISWMMRGRDLGSFGYFKNGNNSVLSSHAYNGPDLSYQQSKATMALLEDKSKNRSYIKENKAKTLPIVGRLQGYHSRGPVKSFSKLSLDDTTNCNDTAVDPSINVRVIGLYPPKMSDWDRIIDKMQVCLRYLTQLGNQRELGNMQQYYKFEMTNPYLKLSSHWHCLYKVIHTEFKLVKISFNNLLVLFLTFL